MQTPEARIGRVIRVGRGWADVSIDRRIVRITTNPELLVRPGGYLKIVGTSGVATSWPETHQPVQAGH
jgi:hypothetical protein